MVDKDAELIQWEKEESLQLIVLEKLNTHMSTQKRTLTFTTYHTHRQLKINHVH